MESTLKLNDLADELLILHKVTIDTLFRLDNCVDCIALYVFYYKTAKWQKTNTIKANDLYVMKSLKWGKDKLKRTKKTLKEHSLINIVQRRKNGKIEGWYVEVAYLVSQKKLEDIKIKFQEVSETTGSENHRYSEPQVVESTSGLQDTNALKEYIKCLEKENEMLKNNNTNASKEDNKKSKKDSFNIIISNYAKDNEEIKELLGEWLKVRKAKRSAMTDRAIEMNIAKLDKLAKESNMTVVEYLKEIICRGWSAFYVIKNYSNYDTKSKTSNSKVSETTRKQVQEYERQIREESEHVVEDFSLYEGLL